MCALGACAAPLARFEFTQPAMGTEFRVVLYADEATRAERAAAAAFERIHALDAALSDYQPESELARLGARSDGGAPTEWIQVSAELFALLRVSADVARASAGAFDVTVGPFTRLWRRARRQGELPGAVALAEAALAVGYEKLELDPATRRVRLLARGMRLDPGGIAKGYALDAALAALVAHGCERALVVGGGDVLAGAPPPGRTGWSVAIAGLDSADPREDRAAARLELAHAALSSSGDMVRFVELDGRRYSHIVDPRSGAALEQRSLASVLAPDGIHADAWATALSVLGVPGLTRLEGEPGLAGRLVVHGAQGLELFESPAFRAALSSPSASIPAATTPPMSHPRPSRRELLRGAVATTVVGPYISTSPLVVRAPGGAEMLKIGLIGCGGRGTGAAVNALRADPNVKLWAMGDAFADMLESSLKSLETSEDTADLKGKLDVPPERRFIGWDAYKQVIASCDVILLATSPHFRPLHLAAAVAAGKHVFVEKPIATDAPGIRSVRATCELARQKKLSIVSGLCYRYEHKKRATIQRLHDGALGDIVALHTTYNAGGLWHRGHKPEWSEMEYQMRNWLYFTWLSGDHIAEQHIHSLDKLAWAMGEYPVRCLSTGGRAERIGPEYGHVYDHFSTVYEWKNGVKGFSYCRQFAGQVQTEVSDWILGTRGKCNIQAAEIDGGPGWSWKWRPEKDDEADDMYQNEHDEMFAAIRRGEPLHNGEYMCDSTQMALMGRLSAYTGQALTWQQASDSQESLAPKAYVWGPIETAPVARPGVTQFS